MCVSGLSVNLRRHLSCVVTLLSTESGGRGGEGRVVIEEMWERWGWGWCVCKAEGSLVSVREGVIGKLLKEVETKLNLNE